VTDSIPGSNRVMVVPGRHHVDQHPISKVEIFRSFGGVIERPPEQ
jgi:hypothetical protein